MYAAFLILVAFCRSDDRKTRKERKAEKAEMKKARRERKSSGFDPDAPLDGEEASEDTPEAEGSADPSPASNPGQAASES